MCHLLISLCRIFCPHKRDLAHSKHSSTKSMSTRNSYSHLCPPLSPANYAYGETVVKCCKRSEQLGVIKSARLECIAFCSPRAPMSKSPPPAPRTILNRCTSVGIFWRTFTTETYGALHTA
ncbi:hypothetical protein WAI453_002945 [Rhynchosporium graminicola]